MDAKGGFQERRYLDFVKSTQETGVDGLPMLNKYSTMLTREHDFPGAQVSNTDNIELCSSAGQFD